MKNIQIGNRIINLASVSHISYEPEVSHPALEETWTECVVSFGCDDIVTLYGQEADLFWRIMADASTTITPRKAA